MIDRISNWFFDSRTFNDNRVKVPGNLIPESLATAYKIQQRNIERFRSITQVAGWKLGATTRATRDIFNTENVYFGPIFKNGLIHLKDSQGIATSVTLPKLFNVNGEPEVCFLLSEKVERIHNPVTADSVDELIESVSIGLEMPDSFVDNIPAHGLPTLIADQCASGALIVGRPLPISAFNRSKDYNVIVSTPDGSLTAGSVASIINNPFGALAEFINSARSLGVELRKGQYVATGGCAPCVPIPKDVEIEVSMEDFDMIRFYLRQRPSV